MRKWSKLHERLDLYCRLADLLPKHPDDAEGGFWTGEYEEIMCKDEAAANALTALFRAIGFDMLEPFYYDDYRSDGINYGWWAVDVAGRE